MQIKKFIFLSTLLVFVFSISCDSGQKSSSVSKAKQSEPEKVEVAGDVSERLVSYLKLKFGSRLPAQADVKVGEFETTSLKGFEKGKFIIEVPGRGQQEVPFLISSDKKYLIIGSDSVIDIGSFKESPVSGFKQGEVFFGRQALPVLVSNDGKHMVVGEVLDSTTDPLKEVRDKISLNNVPVKGNENAKVTVVEYSDFQCPFCKRGSDMLPQILNEYGEKVKIIFKQFPLPNHNWAKNASIASLCSYEQSNDKFWDFHDKVFQKQKEINLENSGDKFKEVANEVGLDIPKFESCLNSEEIEQRLENEIKEAQSLGVRSTPTFIVDGLMVPGANLQGIKNAIDSRLSDKS